MAIVQFSFQHTAPSPESVTVLEHDQLQDKQQREDIIICTHRRRKFETVFQFTDVKWAQVN